VCPSSADGFLLGDSGGIVRGRLSRNESSVQEGAMKKEKTLGRVGGKVGGETRDGGGIGDQLL